MVEESVKITIVICSMLLGLMALAGAAWGTLGLQTAFGFLGFIGLMFTLALFSGPHDC